MSINQLAKIAGKHVGKSPSTIKGWFKEGLDIADLSAVKAFSDKKDLTSCGRARANAIARRYAEVPKRPNDVAKAEELVAIDPGSEGAAAALKRLQEFERNSAIRLNAAIATNEPILTSSATKDHVAIAGALIKFENLVSQEARASGELISKAEMERAVAAIADWIRLSFQSWLSSETPNLVAINDPKEFAAAARTGFAGAVKACFMNSRKSRNAIPEWIDRIFSDEYNYGPR
jgi:transcription elongation GreA/GreB family factor